MPTLGTEPIQIHGYFFNSKYWHHERNFILNEVLAFDVSIDDYLKETYSSLLPTSDADSGVEVKETCSVHLRLGYSSEPAKVLVKDRAFPPKHFLQTALERIGPAVTFVIFADDLNTARKMLEPAEQAGYSFVYVDENVVMSVRLMSLCKHHILTSSTLSFWGAYLDQRQPNGGKTILHESFFVSHGRNMIPYSTWEVIKEG